MKSANVVSGAVGALLLAGANGANAQSETRNYDFYVGGYGLVVAPANQLDVETGFGGGALVGAHLARYLKPIAKIPYLNTLQLELDWRGYFQDGEDDAGSVDANILSGNLLLPVYAKKDWTAFFVAGAGHLYSDYPAGNESGAAWSVGPGLTYRIAEGLLVRGEARWVGTYVDTDPNIPQTEDEFLSHGHFSLGLVKLFGKDAPPAAVPPPPPAEPAAAAAPPLPKDSDGDGVLDDKDQCPDTPKGLKVDAVGCVRDGQTIALESVTFEFNKDILTLEARTTLDAAAQGLSKQKGLRLEVAGHTDARGSDSYNLQLSARRAAAVRAYLISRGVAADSLTSQGYGETQPVASNQTDEGRAQNRRVEFRILGRAK